MRGGFRGPFTVVASLERTREPRRAHGPIHTPSRKRVEELGHGVVGRLRRGDPAVQDQKINSHSKLNCILASIQATQAGADEALMLDPHGFVATCNSTHFFIVRKGEVWTSSGKYCLGGITRAVVLEVCREAGIPAHEKDFSLTDAYGADEAFVTGTFAGIVPVREVDGRQLACRGPMVERLQQLYRERVDQDVADRQRS